MGAGGIGPSGELATGGAVAAVHLGADFGELCGGFHVVACRLDFSEPVANGVFQQLLGAHGGSVAGFDFGSHMVESGNAVIRLELVHGVHGLGGGFLHLRLASLIEQLIGFSQLLLEPCLGLLHLAFGLFGVLGGLGVEGFCFL